MNITKLQSVKNIYNVPLKLWAKFKTDEARNVYNLVMKQSLKNQGLTCHPHMPKMSKDQWITICHNMAVYAAWAVAGRPAIKGDVVIDLKAGKETKRRVLR